MTVGDTGRISAELVASPDNLAFANAGAESQNAVDACPVIPGLSWQCLTVRKSVDRFVRQLP